MKIHISDEVIEKFGKNELLEVFGRDDCEFDLEHTIKKHYPNEDVLYYMSDMGDAYLFVNNDDSSFSLLEDLK